MALYTFLLALGAAMPLAASYQEGLAARSPEGSIHCGGYARRVAVEQSDEDEASERPRVARAVACDDVVELAPVAPAHDGRIDGADHTSSRGS